MSKRNSDQSSTVPPASENSSESACGPGCCGDASRRAFLQVVGIGAGAMLAGGGTPRAMAGPFDSDDFARLVPPDKKLDPEWVRSLFTRGEPTVHQGAALDLIGMPIGGLCAGQLYLGGDGKLWHWDVFNRTIGTNEAHYADPLRPKSPLDQGFAVRIRREGRTEVKTLDRRGFADIRFRGEYPIGFATYEDPSCPVRVELDAFSPFIPLNVDDSSLPATVLVYRVKNTSSEPVEVEIGGWLENAVCLETGESGEGTKVNTVVREPGLVMVASSAEPAIQKPHSTTRPPIVVADFEGGTYGDWTTEGEAFGKAPSTGSGPGQFLKNQLGKGLANSWTGTDALTGKLISPPFAIERSRINFLIGGGDYPRQTCVNLKVEGRDVLSAVGKRSDAMDWTSWDVRHLAGKTARIEIVDAHSGDWGHIVVDQIELADEPRNSLGPVALRRDFGTMALALLAPTEHDQAKAAIASGDPAGALFGDAPSARQTFGNQLTGAVVRPMTLAPGQVQTATFVIAWHFPNLSLPGTRLPADLGRYYASRFAKADDVVRYMASNFERLEGQTRLWHRTWYDSTLPYWFLDRTFANTSILATSTCHRFRNGRFYGWEGVGCCAGTCTHVWHYAQAAARLFPELERILRERVDYADGIGFDPVTGIISHRAEEPVGPAVDGQAGIILRTYREHQTSPDAEFLKRLWPKVKKSLEYLIQHDRDRDGILDGPQHNTLDAAWFGEVPWLSSLYIAALRAGEAMAGELGDDAFASQCRTLAERGANNLVKMLWNESYGYFIQRGDPAHAKAVGSYDGCEIDQVFGQHWAHQVGLGRILSEPHVHRALQALWTYNFTPDVGPYREVNKPGRWYAMPGEAGLLMVTFPKSKRPGIDDPSGGWSAMYFNECMNGFEYQVAGHMIWEGMVQEGLAISRAVHDRYDASRRNPWNEVECGDHYARSMASYGVYLAACGFEYHGPKGRLAFGPKVSPDDFRAAFTTSEGWGTYAQKRIEGALVVTIAPALGRLKLRTLGLATDEKPETLRIKATLGEAPVEGVKIKRGKTDGTIDLEFPAELQVEPGRELVVSIG